MDKFPSVTGCSGVCALRVLLIGPFSHRMKLQRGRLRDTLADVTGYCRVSAATLSVVPVPSPLLPQLFVAVKQMALDGVDPDAISYRQALRACFVGARGDGRAAEEALYLVKDMERRGLPLDVATLEALVR